MEEGVLILKKYVDEEQLNDYIIETGTSNGWYFQKWNSGKYEAQCVVNEILNYYTITNGFYGYHSSRINYPITFKEIPVLLYNAKVGSGFAIPGGDVQSNSNYCMLYALSTYSQENAACIWEVEVKGRWK